MEASGRHGSVADRKAFRRMSHRIFKAPAIKFPEASEHNGDPR